MLCLGTILGALLGIVPECSGCMQYAVQYSVLDAAYRTIPAHTVPSRAVLCEQSRTQHYIVPFLHLHFYNAKQCCSRHRTLYATQYVTPILCQRLPPRAALSDVLHEVLYADLYFPKSLYYQLAASYRALTSLYIATLFSSGPGTPCKHVCTHVLHMPTHMSAHMPAHLVHTCLAHACTHVCTHACR